MNTEKSNYLKLFNQHFFEMFEDILTIFPNNKEISFAKTSFENIKKINPTSIIKIWYLQVFIPYQNEINEGNISFFIEKNYSSDLEVVPNSQDIMKMIDNVRSLASSMSIENQKHTMKYVKNLSILSIFYNDNDKK
jgi:hypothetical protein